MHAARMIVVPLYGFAPLSGRCVAVALSAASAILPSRSTCEAASLSSGRFAAAARYLRAAYENALCSTTAATNFSCLSRSSQFSSHWVHAVVTTADCDASSCSLNFGIKVVVRPQRRHAVAIACSAPHLGQVIGV